MTDTVPVVPSGKRRVCIVLATRGNYAKMRTTMKALAEQPDTELQIILGGGLVLERYGNFESVIAADGFTIQDRLQFMVQGETPSGIAASAGLCVMAVAQSLDRLRPDIVIVIADRFESLSIAQAALCLNIPIAHLEGGEVSGSIDERIRHAITKLAHLHFVANTEAAVRVERMGEDPQTIHVVGSPSLDQLATIDTTDLGEATAHLLQHGQGRQPDLKAEFVVVSQHPVVTQYEEAAAQIMATVEAVRLLGQPAVWILPNLDAGAETINRLLESLCSNPAMPPIRFVGGLPFPIYATLLANARCLIGNTSSGLREAAFLGTPVVNIGDRQRGRARGPNVLDVPNETTAILEAANRQIAHGFYPSNDLYGNGRAGYRIAEVLRQPFPPLDKMITY